MTMHDFPSGHRDKHILSGENCPCDPDVLYIDEETGLPYDDAPIIVHRAPEGWTGERSRVDEYFLQNQKDK